jgi:anti-sigma regulatory factor (Ser/Thr protein kinase)
VRAAVTEACVICIRHADGGDSESGTFVLEASTAEGDLIVRVSDQNRCFDAEQRQLDGELGLELIEDLADAQEITRLDGGATCIVLRFGLL